MPIARSTIAGAVTGVLLLGGAVGFAVGLPKVSEDPGASISADSLPKLPDRLDDRMVALSRITAEDAGTTNPEDIKAIDQIATAAADGDTKASSKVASIYGPSEVRAYIDVKAMAQATAQSAPAQVAVTVTAGGTGLVIPSGPFEINQNGGSHYELREVGGHRCAVAWQQPTDPTTGMPTAGDVPPGSYQTECRAERDGLSYDVYATGLSPDEAASYLDLVLERTASDD
ncbi:hypothetical protein ACIRN4_14345 [Pimelobacter simplex]|uniref:Uncharacterized protein n=1 Tax=Nocardioides simplex TaxID=2045 RepID=A0A7J5DSY9_NOCSI|nr:hypothetical protein [Pimelobacter simplex]KAB2808268.1 hypothetical protein F9L07_22375 [Pimelobacter simplex]